MNSPAPSLGQTSQLSPLQRAVLAIDDLQARLKASEQARHEPIAVVGLGCRFPGADGVAKFWDLLRAGRDAVREVPRSRWNIDDFYDPDPDAPGKMSSRWGGFLDAVDQFDPEFFGISPREATFMDPQQRLLLEVAWEAIENAGQSPQDLASSPTGIFLGLTSDEYAQISFREGDLSRFNAYFASGVARSIAAGRIAYVLGLHGPNMAIDTACSSSLVAVHSACMSLRARECRTALAGGATVVLSPEIGIAFSKAHMMAADGRCKAFDARADGFVRGEGCGIVVLKRQADALADGDRILALIRGSAMNQDGRSSGMTAPSPAAQEAVIRKALAQAGVKPAEVGYVEAHGTGTSLGDPIEAHALAEVLCAGRDREHSLLLGSVKTNIGHLEAAAGIAGLIKVILMLGHELIPRHLHFKEQNPHIDWEGRPVEIAIQARPWLRSEQRRVAGVSSFGFSGTNAHVIVEEAPLPGPRQPLAETPLCLLVLSARSESALRALGESYAEVLAEAQLPLEDLCFTASAGRSHFEQRLAAAGSSPEELRQALLQALPGRRVLEREGVRPVLLFRGQGFHFPGTGKSIFEMHPGLRSTVEQCAQMLEGELEIPLLDVLWGSSTHLLEERAYSLPAWFVVQYALAELWRSWGVQPLAVLGHGAGAFVAACVAEVFSLADGLKLVARQGRAVQAPFEEAVRSTVFRSPQMPTLSGVTGQVVSCGEMSDPAFWRREVSEPARLQSATSSLHEIGAALLLECGPGAALSEVGGQCPRDEADWSTGLGPEGNGWAEILKTLAELYTRGASLDWPAFHRPFHPRRVSLPTYPFVRQRYWIPPAERAKNVDPRPAREKALATSLAHSGKAPPVAREEWFYRVAWKQLDPPKAEDPACRTWVLLSDHTGVAQALCTHMQAAGCRCLLMDSIAPGMVRTHLHSQSGETGVIDFRYLDLVGNAAEASCLQFVSLIQEMAQVTQTRITLWNVTRGALATGRETGPVLPWLSPVWALGRTVASEHPEFWGGMVDLDPSASLAETGDQLWQHLKDPGREDQIAFRNGHRLAARLERYGPTLPAGQLRLHADAAYLVTGGHGGLGLEIAHWLAKQGAKHLLLLGRTPLPPRSEWDGLAEGAPHSRTVRGILKMEELGATVDSVSVDVGDADAITSFLRSYKLQNRPPLRGVLHAAGAMKHALLVETTEDHLRLAFRAKVDGTWVLHEALNSTKLDFFVTFSSASAVLSSPRLGSYAASNAFLDALAVYRNSLGFPALSVDWGIWTDVGMARQPARTAPATIERDGMQGMSVDQGLACLGRLMDGSAGQVCVLPLDWKVWNELYPAYMAKPFFSDLYTDRETQAAQPPPREQAPELLRRLKNIPPSMRLDQIGVFVQTIAASLLGFPVNHSIDPLQPLNEMGLDSLMALEMLNAVSAGIGQSLPATLLFNYPTIADITNHLNNLLFAPPADGKQMAPLPDGKRSVLDDIEELTDEEVDRMLAGKVGPSR